MTKILLATVILLLLLGNSTILCADPLVGSDSYFDEEGDLIKPIAGLEKLCNGEIHALKWKSKICYLSIRKNSGPGYCNYTLSLSREENPKPEDFSGNYRKHILMTAESRYDITHLDKSKLVIYSTSSFQRYMMTFDFNPENDKLIKVVGKCGYRPFMPVVMTGCPQETKSDRQKKKETAFNKLYKE